MLLSSSSSARAPCMQRRGGLAAARPPPQQLRLRPLLRRRLAAASSSSSGDEAEGAKVVVEAPSGSSVAEAPPAVVVAEPSAAGAADDAAAAAAGVASHPLAEMFNAKELLDELQDQSSWGKRGEGWVLAQLGALAFVLLPPFSLTGLVDILATLLITAGLVFIVYSLMSLGRYLSPLPAPRRNHKLVTSGMYSYARHPMYGGLLMAAFGLAVITRNETRLAMAALLWLVLEQKVKVEEKLLLERYGASYEEYKARVMKYFPFPRL